MNPPISMSQNIKSKSHHQLIDDESELTARGKISEIELDNELCKKQQTLSLAYTEIYFPHKPYDVQLKYMESVVQSLDRKHNALLESPTGTGKTLSLLCASLGWLSKHRKEQQKANNPTKLRIIYASRTHAQLKQVAQELKKTVYKPNVSVLGSRDQYCLRGDFYNIKGNLLNQNCRKVVKANQCQYFKKDVVMFMALQYKTLINNLEEAKQFGYKNKICPYYFERQRMDEADIILLPYNYLLEKDFQDYVNIDNSILIFDEAHNVQSTAEEGSSFFITQNIIIEAEKDLEKWIDELETVPIFYEQLKVKLNQAKLVYELKEYRSIVVTIRTFSQYLEQLKQQPIFTLQDTNEKYQILDARQIQSLIFQYTSDQDNTFRLWNDSMLTNYAKGITRNNIARYLSHCMILIDVMSELSQFPAHHFESWTKFIMNVYDLIRVEDEREKQKQSLSSLQNQFNQYKLSFMIDVANQITIYMWCLEPSLAFQRILSKNIHSVLLTSGTLSPLQSWTCELRMNFQTQFSSPHIINIQQNLIVFQHKQFDFSYQQRNNDEQFNRLGQNLLNYSYVIPNGILVIFSSYSLMFKFRSKLTTSKLLFRLNEIKHCLWEPQQTVEMQNVFELYKQHSKKGAIMFAVQRGKVAEGIDFSDELCRAVFLVGVPYPPKQDHKVSQKMEYLEKIYNDPEFNDQDRLKSQEWYCQQAIRATNQALGRVIRHVNDYGIVFLCDKRFEYTDIRKGFSEWVKTALKPWANDDEVLKQTKAFYNRTDNNFQTPSQKIMTEEKSSQQSEVKKRNLKLFGLKCQKQLEKLKSDSYNDIEGQEKPEYQQIESKQVCETEEKQQFEQSEINFTPSQAKNKIKIQIQSNKAQVDDQIVNSALNQQKLNQIQNNDNNTDQFNYFTSQKDFFSSIKQPQQQSESQRKGIIKIKQKK
ncbi:unnamed protein product (macronuclear) [Paramecium tetraurelia]|uniref:Helicase ATP-binding domain-containing protein n=1 Tax=Paramecium tetraurelia TaxID=5888 RepID=A0CUS4_PARTE|nr:uncharacterized protein GSPATT00010742001 [Paramecium tetraurelia]CAK74541.1 unnamed protein product [Paramecium tetraurelia]|eukprot:XP_001441938.1 hypothetical protein (macronuclear) [Paramecium tetraurelia strain d4-2]